MTGLSHGGHYSTLGRTAEINFMKQQITEHEKRHPLPESPPPKNQTGGKWAKNHKKQQSSLGNFKRHVRKNPVIQ
jgi:hypothetical protein